MKLILYESASRGGNFEYSKKLFTGYKKHQAIESIQWIIPSSADVSPTSGILKILANDRHFGKFYFFYRSLINPITLFRHLVTLSSSHVVILNDFEQLTAPLWVPVFKMFLRRHKFAVFLHDPDRDAYPPSRSMSRFSMKMMMSLMDIALYHEQLPDKPYYRHNNKTRYLDVPHGQYQQQPADPLMSSTLPRDLRIVSIIGNIRSEKNYELAIKAVAMIPGIRLIIAGSESNSSVDVGALKRLANDRVTFIIKYLSDAEMSSIIDASDLILLNYKDTFTSQSGIFNLLAPYRKPVIISRTNSALTATAIRFGIGTLVKPDDLEDLVNAIPIAMISTTNGWQSYLEYASWENHVNIVIDEIKKLYPDAV